MLVRAAIDDLPLEFHRALEHVAVVVSDSGRRQRAYGLYQGDTIAQDYFHDRIVIFRDTLLRDFGHDPDLLKAQVTRTLRHELAHHLGWDEKGVRGLGVVEGRPAGVCRRLSAPRWPAPGRLRLKTGGATSGALIRLACRAARRAQAAAFDVVAARLLAGIDHHVPACTVNRSCASSPQTLRMAFHAIKAGEGDQYIAAGVEAVSRAGLGAGMMEEAKNPHLNGSNGSAVRRLHPDGDDCRERRRALPRDPRAARTRGR